MHTEQLQNVRPTWVAFGWFAAASVTGLAMVALIALGILSPASENGGGWILLALVIGFLAGGWLVGWRTGKAPLLHGIGIGLFSLVAWLLLNLFADVTDLADWSGLTPGLTAGILLLQIASAAGGAWYGTRHHAVGV
ncbi:MAG: hypothetical protein M3P24_07310 [Gemmatimonadota bacterium]|nr:hypothetical protein [Gemmatimonadota bacterium]